MAGHWITIDGHHVLIEDDKNGPGHPHQAGDKGKPHLKKMVKVSVKRPIGYRMADIGPGGKEYNVVESPEYHEYNRDLKLRLRNKQVGSGMKYRP